MSTLVGWAVCCTCRRQRAQHRVRGQPQPRGGREGACVRASYAPLDDEELSSATGTRMVILPVIHRVSSVALKTLRALRSAVCLVVSEPGGRVRSLWPRLKHLGGPEPPRFRVHRCVGVQKDSTRFLHFNRSVCISALSVFAASPDRTLGLSNLETRILPPTH